MKRTTVALLATSVIFLACGGPQGAVEELPPQAATVETFRVGVLVDDASPAKVAFTQAAHLAESQLNQALMQSGIGQAFTLVVAPYAAGQARAVAIDLINNQGVLALVTDGDFTTAEVNGLNYDFDQQVAHKFTVTCTQCSSPRFNQFFESEPGFSDPENWLFRTYFNAGFEPAVQMHLVLARPNGGDLNNDHHLKVVVYYDFPHSQEAFGVEPALDSLDPAGAHSVETVFKVTPSTPSARADEMAAIFDAAPDGHPPDVVYLAVSPSSFVEALSDYNAFNVSPGPRPPALANDEIRRDFRLPALLAAGGASLEGMSVTRVSSTASGPLFRTAFVGANGQQPEVSTSFLYDAVVAQAMAIGWARSFGSIDPQVIQGNFSNVNDPTGTLIRPSVKDFKTAVQRIKKQQPINYDGASSPLDLTFDGELYPELVHWKIQSGSFVELERYRCDPDNPTCVALP